MSEPGPALPPVPEPEEDDTIEAQNVKPGQLLYFPNGRKSEVTSVLNDADEAYVTINREGGQWVVLRNKKVRVSSADS